MDRDSESINSESDNVCYVEVLEFQTVSTIEINVNTYETPFELNVFIDENDNLVTVLENNVDFVNEENVVNTFNVVSDNHNNVTESFVVNDVMISDANLCEYNNPVPSTVNNECNRNVNITNFHDREYHRLSSISYCNDISEDLTDSVGLTTFDNSCTVFSNIDGEGDELTSLNTNIELIPENSINEIISVNELNNMNHLTDDDEMVSIIEYDELSETDSCETISVIEYDDDEENTRDAISYLDGENEVCLF